MRVPLAACLELALDYNNIAKAAMFLNMKRNML